MTRSGLLDVIYRFYPRGVSFGNDAYPSTEERHRLMDASQRAAAEYPTWAAMIGRLDERHPMQDESLHVLGGLTDAAYSARVYLSDQCTLGFHVSFIGPYYAIHRMGWPDEEPFVQAIDREIRAACPRHEPIPPELGNEIVPDVSPDTVPLGEATVYVCLLSVRWLSCSVRLDAP